MTTPTIDRRGFLTGTAATAGAAWLSAVETAAQSKQVVNGRIHQSASHWNFSPLTLEELAVAAVKLGLKSVELVGPENFPLLRRFGLTCAIFGRHSFNKGFAHVEEHGECVAACMKALDEAADFGAPNVITFSGFARGIGREEGIRNMVDGLKKLAAHAEKREVTLCLEMLNSKVDVPMKGHPDYFCDDIDMSVDIVKAVSSERVKVLFDIYHVQIMHGDVISRIRQHAKWIGHVHTAGNPGRCDLDAADQELSYPAIMRALIDVGYKGFVGQEFIPLGPEKADKLKALAEAVKICDV